jgi:hypothetical protein
LEEFDAFFREHVPVINYGDPDIIALLSYLDGDGCELRIVHVFRHADAFDAHFKGSEERDRVAGEYLESLAWEIYGTPSEETLLGLQARAAENSVGLVIFPDNFGGYLRASD